MSAVARTRPRKTLLRSVMEFSERGGRRRCMAPQHAIAKAGMKTRNARQAKRRHESCQYSEQTRPGFSQEGKITPAAMILTHQPAAPAKALAGAAGCYGR